MNSGAQLKEHGQQLAIWNAGANWLEQTLDNLKAFCKVRKDIGRPEFRAEELRQIAAERGWPMPPSPNAWGAIPAIAARRGIIKFTGRYENAQSPRTRSHPVKVWEAL